jgi:hypothetical protein
MKENLFMLNRGPVDVVIMAAAHPKFDGSVFAELERQVAAGTIRVLDAILLAKDEAGQYGRLELKDLPPEIAAALGSVGPQMRGLFDVTDQETLAEGMVPGSVIFGLAIEHTWALALVNALDQAGVELAMNFRVPAPVVDDAFASLAAV